MWPMLIIFPRINECSCVYNEQIYHFEITQKSYANTKEKAEENINQNIMI